MLMSDNTHNFMLGDIEISPQHNTISRDEHECRLQPKVMALLHYLYQHRERVIGNEELLEHVWQGRVVTHNSIQKSVNALRAALAEFEPEREYVMYFSKRGYQLVTSGAQPPPERHLKANWRIGTYLLPGTLLIIAAIYLLSAQFERTDQAKSAATLSFSRNFTQLKPYLSNTGRERIIEPYLNSERAAFILDQPDSAGVSASRLMIHSNSGSQWQLSVARGEFVDLAWSASGRNLVALERHHASEASPASHSSASEPWYYSLHIFTLDFKGEKLIEKNLLSHWQGSINSVSWWNEATLEFVAAQGQSSQFMRYHYHIAEQNLLALNTTPAPGQLLATQVFNQLVAELRQLDSAMQIRFFSEQHQLSKYVLTQPVVSMSWLADGSGLLILTDDGQLSVLTQDANLYPVTYLPKLSGQINRARSSDQANSLVLTVQGPLVSEQARALQNTDAESSSRFLAQSGGFIYTP